MDKSLLNWFKDFEERPVTSKDKIPWNFTIELEIQGEYIINSLDKLTPPENAGDAELLEISEYCGNLIDYIEQMRIMGYSGFPEAIESLFEKRFANRFILRDLQAMYFEQWLKNKNGQFEIGLNNFCILNDKVYYFNFHKIWKEVDKNSVFKIDPIFTNAVSDEKTKILSEMHRPSRYQKIYESWKKENYTGKYFLSGEDSKHGVTNPESVLKNTLDTINKILDDPISFNEIELEISGDLDYLENLIKISCLIADFARDHRSKKELSLYLLRDCAMFNEAQFIYDKLEGKNTYHEQVYLGRQSLSSRNRDAGHWFLCQELLLVSLKKHPRDFNKFYEDFSYKLKQYEIYSADFNELVQNLTKYLNNHIKEANEKDLTINVIDLGFQGSINMMVKYVLDNYCIENNNKSKILIYVAAEWFKGVYKNMYASNSFSTLTEIEVLSRNNEIYNYVPRSLKNGGLKVSYGNEKSQEKANLELSVMIMTILSSYKQNL